MSIALMWLSVLVPTTLPKYDVSRIKQLKTAAEDEGYCQRSVTNYALKLQL